MRHDDPLLLGDHLHAERKGLLALSLFVQTGDGEDFEGSAEVDDLHVREDQDFEPLSAHRNLLDLIRGNDGSREFVLVVVTGPG
jgi:hypothetical protein